MDIIEFAMKMEQDGKQFYEKSAAETTDPELKKILVQLAEEERNHYEFFRRMKEKPIDLSAGEVLSGESTLKEVKNIFEVMASNKDKKPFGEDVVAVWTQALRTEEKAVKFYTEEAAKESDDERKGLLLKIAKEEENHVLMIDSVLMYVKHPAAFAASAQYKNFRSAEGF
ncbi:MAG: ferritin family protein [candidate division Zixibacteria bacterium]|nr:ferritin family protein [candidate division Zixibacteria bacterium]